MQACDSKDPPPKDDVFWVDVDRSDDPTDAAKLEFTIDELAGELGITQRALRYYETRSLIFPTRRGRRRVYSRADRDRLSLILKGKKLGFTLNEIGQMIEAQAGRASQQSLKLTAEKCLEQIAHFERQLTETMAILAELRRIHALLRLQVMRGAGREPPSDEDS